MPFADVPGLIARVIEPVAQERPGLGHQRQVVAEAAVVQRVLARHQHAPPGRADRLIAETVGKAHGILREAIGMRRADLLVAVTAEHVE